MVSLRRKRRSEARCIGAMQRGGEIDLPCTARGIVTRETPEAMSRTGRTIAPRDNEALATSFRVTVGGMLDRPEPLPKLSSLETSDDESSHEKLSRQRASCERLTYKRSPCRKHFLIRRGASDNILCSQKFRYWKNLHRNKKSFLRSNYR